jgi:hypothetical protein
MDDLKTQVHETLSAINRAWRENRPLDMKTSLHADVTMAFPGFTDTVTGRDVLLEGFVEFCTNARVIEYEETDEQIQVVGHIAVASFRFNMLYERASYRERSTGRDLWVFEQSNGKWIAVWRTMLEIKEERQT